IARTSTTTGVSGFMDSPDKGNTSRVDANGRGGSSARQMIVTKKSPIVANPVHGNATVRNSLP
ncbi:MAG: hypothetical protein Q8Q74_13155, partial [Polaromonas sp.]|nr:hypothetical protein [Polaromonas sp.]